VKGVNSVSELHEAESRVPQLSLGRGATCLFSAERSFRVPVAEQVSPCKQRLVTPLFSLPRRNRGRNQEPSYFAAHCLCGVQDVYTR
jgi:hypothetical protein